MEDAYNTTRPKMVMDQQQNSQRQVSEVQRSLIDSELFRITGVPRTPSSRDQSMRPIVSEPPRAMSSPAVAPRNTPQQPVIPDDLLICKVQTKMCFRHCACPVELQPFVNVGSFVIITGYTESNGMEDLGVVTRIFTVEQWEAKKASVRPSNDKEEAEIRSVLRVANESECRLLPQKYAKEEEMLRLCQDYVKIFNLPMAVYGADFEWDGKVLTFYYTSEQRVDYRELVRLLFNKCMVRIRMRKTNQCKQFAPVNFATLALRTGVKVSSLY